MAVFLFSCVLHWQRALNAWLPSTFTSLQTLFQAFDEVEHSHFFQPCKTHLMQRSIDWSYWVTYVLGKVITLLVTIRHWSRGEHFTINGFASHVTLPNYFPRQRRLEPGSYCEKYSASFHLRFLSYRNLIEEKVKWHKIWTSFPLTYTLN